MTEATQTARELIPPTLNKRAANDSEGPKQTTTPKEMERTPANQAKIPLPLKLPSKPSTLESADLFGPTAAGANREVSMLFSTFAQVLSETAAADTALMKELDGLLAEAHKLESYLKDKKKQLRETLTLLCEKLQD